MRTVTRCTKILLLGLLPAPMLTAAELRQETLQAYNQYIARAERDFMQRVKGDNFFWFDDSPERRRKVRDGEVAVEAAREDGIIDVPGGLVHNWIAAAFIPGVTLEDVLAVNQDYSNYTRIHEPVIRSRLLKQEGNTYHVFMRLKKSLSFVTAVVDIWPVVEYHSTGKGRAYGTSETDRVMQVQNEGEPNERRLPPGEGDGYLWRANAYSKFLERDGGVYMELETVGLTNNFPSLLGRVIEPIARSVGKSSAQQSLKELRRAVLKRRTELGRGKRATADGF